MIAVIIVLQIIEESTCIVIREYTKGFLSAASFYMGIFKSKVRKK